MSFALMGWIAWLARSEPAVAKYQCVILFYFNFFFINFVLCVGKITPYCRYRTVHFIAGDAMQSGSISTLSATWGCILVGSTVGPRWRPLIGAADWLFRGREATWCAG